VISGVPVVAHLDTSNLNLVNATSEQIDDRARTVKVYPGCVYENYHRLGMSLIFKPTSGYKLFANATEASLNLDQLILDSVDIVIPIIDDANPNSHKTANKTHQSFPGLPIEIHLSTTSPSADNISETSKTTAIPTTFVPAQNFYHAGRSAVSIR
jgi:hypothetical protein